MLSDQQAEDIRRGLEGGTRGPVLIKWVRLLLADRDERVKVMRDAGWRAIWFPAVPGRRR
jgi:hypothetical protein